MGSFLAICRAAFYLFVIEDEFWWVCVVFASITNIHISECTTLEIPKKTTGQIQPLDVFFNGQMKVIPHRLYDRVLLDELVVNINERNYIIHLVPLTHSQLSAGSFGPMMKYDWYASGSVDNHPGSFKTLTNVCFPFETEIYVISSWHAAPFTCCSWRGKRLCFKDFS